MEPNWTSRQILQSMITEM